MTETLAAETAPKVTMITGSLSPRAGGMYYSARLPANIMAAQGRAPHVLGVSDDQLAQARESWQVPRLDAVSAPAGINYLATPALYRRLIEVAPDVVHLRGIWAGHSAASFLWRRRIDRPLVISPHGMLDQKALDFGRRKKAIMGTLYEWRNLRTASTLHALNRSEADSMRALGLENPIALIPNGVDLHPLPDRRSEATASRREILFLGRIHPKKGIAELLHGWHRFTTKRNSADTEWNLVIAGWDDGGHRPVLEALAERLGLNQSVRFAGPLYGEEKREAFDRASAFILPSFSEGLPISVLEAWERGVPVLMTEYCNLPEGFSAGAAQKIRPEPSAIADALETLCAQPPAAIEAMGSAGRELVESRFGWQNIARDYMRLYDWLHGVGEKPGFVETA